MEEISLSQYRSTNKKSTFRLQKETFQLTGAASARRPTAYLMTTVLVVAMQKHKA